MVGVQSTARPDLATLDAIHETALSHLSGDVVDFLEGGAGSEYTLNANERAYSKWQFAQRTMSGLARPDLSASLLGVPLAMPILTAPFGADRMFDREGQLAVARANDAAGVASIVPEAGSHSLEEVMQAAPHAARFCQLHPMGTLKNFQRMIKRAEDAGYSGLCLTVDCPTGGWRERLVRNSFNLDESYISGNYPPDRGVVLSEVFGQLFERDARVWSWDELAEAMTVTKLPWMVKGIMTAADALEAETAGAAAVYVSNHGGRQLDGVPATLEALVDVSAALAGRLPVAVDGGVRRGEHVIKALCLGADVVVIGRLAAYGLAAAGQQGVERVHELLRDEMRTVLTLLGHGGASDMGPSALQMRIPRS